MKTKTTKPNHYKPNYLETQVKSVNDGNKIAKLILPHLLSSLNISKDKKMFLANGSKSKILEGYIDEFKNFDINPLIEPFKGGKVSIQMYLDLNYSSVYFRVKLNYYGGSCEPNEMKDYYCRYIEQSYFLGRLKDDKQYFDTLQNFKKDFNLIDLDYKTELRKIKDYQNVIKQAEKIKSSISSFIDKSGLIYKY